MTVIHVGKCRVCKRENRGMDFGNGFGPKYCYSCGRRKPIVTASGVISFLVFLVILVLI